MDFVLGVLAKFFGHSLGLPPQYKFVKRLGKGTEGDVWMCTDEQRNCMVAVKLVPRGPPAWRLAMVAREGRMLARLGAGHINIVRPLEIVLTSRHLAFITEYVPGGSLSDYLVRNKMDEDVARYFFKQLLAAIRYCHEQQVVYRDIKPANALITATRPPFLKLCDFGLAHTWAGKEEPVFETLAGTPGYMCPEILEGFFAPDKSVSRPYDGVKADVYSAGVMLVVMLLHTMPWHYDTYAARLPPLEAMRKLYTLENVEGVHWRDATSKAARLSEPLAALLDTMLEPDTLKRASLEDVCSSQWVNLPLPPKLQAALDVLQEQQALRETAVCEGTDRGLPQDEVTRRLEAFEAMAKAAETVGKGLKLEQRLRLAQPSMRQQQQQVQQQQQQREEQQQQAQQQEQAESSSVPAAAAAAAADMQEAPAVAAVQPAVVAAAQ
ncbi:hypothetical protein OEZ85_011300 [Tetradesmus obliquus]|uniref:Protein kinase domain-containing protein n=1 Tax=Tetradesmus obliquus TaxID=3088 RepID=A0ABY8TPX2_TETOB|nr:hypothetical protein OEZ85_011300 [Tetradesmus obliquus]